MLTGRLKEYGNDAKKAFSNLDEKPIWLNKEKGIPIKRVTISGISNAQSLHVKRIRMANQYWMEMVEIFLWILLIQAIIIM